jgi:hypothetical protein
LTSFSASVSPFRNLSICSSTSAVLEDIVSYMDGCGWLVVVCNDAYSAQERKDGRENVCNNSVCMRPTASLKLRGHKLRYFSSLNRGLVRLKETTPWQNLVGMTSLFFIASIVCKHRIPTTD